MVYGDWINGKYSNRIQSRLAIQQVIFQHSWNEYEDRTNNSPTSNNFQNLRPMRMDRMGAGISALCPRGSGVVPGWFRGACAHCAGCG